MLSLITLEFIGIMLRLFQTLGNLNTTLNLVFNSHVHLEKTESLEKNKTEKRKIRILNPKLKSDIAMKVNQ